MIINHNMSALNTYRQLTINNNAISKSLEKLSSGLRINRAGDDAAGLAISEKMRAQVRGLDQAQRNAQDGISLIQTAEGALNETHSILQRMRELAVQAANDTNTDTDRAELQKEVDQLAEELTRIAENTEFNTQKLLDGTFKGIFHIGANSGQNIELNIGNMSADALGVKGGTAGLFVGNRTASATIDGSGWAAEHGASYNVVKLSEEQSFTAGTNEHILAYGIKGSDGKFYGFIDKDGRKAIMAENAATNFNEVVLDDDNILDFGDGYSVTSGTVTVTYTAGDGTTEASLTADSAVAVFSGSAKIAAGTYKVVDEKHAFVGTGDFALADAKGNLVAYSTDGNDWKDLEGNALFTHNLTGNVGQEVKIKGAGGIDISSQAAADAAITTIQKAIETVSAERSKLGAFQNRLEHTINNLGTASENLTAAESRIRDVDMAKEMMEFQKNNILAQAAQAMLAQANQMPQAVLQLLR